MRLQNIKILTITLLLVLSCISCEARNSSSQASKPKVKTTKKAPKAKTSQPTVQPSTKLGQQLQVIEVKSEKMGRNISNLVVLPEQYLKDSSSTYPVLYLLHGYSDNYMAWQNHVDLTKHANKYGFIIVCPDGQDSWYFDSPIDPTFQFETYVTQELRNYVEKNYRTINDRQHRAITGLSMGGHGALWLAWRHPDIYGMCGSMSGGVDITTIKDHYKIDKRLGKYAENQESWKNHSVINLVPTLKNDQFIIIDDGTSDIFIKDNRALHAALQQHKIKHDYSERPGRHSWDYWIKSLENHLISFHSRICQIKMGDC
ncbi:MAG: esterase family protein [Muribaculaceae bacterium]|nr:esterase family protein [Muribaculaceae bacterium]